MADRYRLVFSGATSYWDTTTYWSSTVSGTGGESAPLSTDTAYLTRTITGLNYINMRSTITTQAIVAGGNSIPNYYVINDGQPVTGNAGAGTADGRWSYPSNAYVQVDADNFLGIYGSIQGTTVLRKTGDGVLALGGIIDGGTLSANWTGGFQVEAGTVRLSFNNQYSFPTRQASTILGATTNPVVLWDGTSLVKGTNYDLNIANNVEIVSNADATIVHESGVNGVFYLTGTYLLNSGATLTIDNGGKPSLCGIYGAISGGSDTSVVFRGTGTSFISDNSVNGNSGFKGTFRLEQGGLTIVTAATAQGMVNALFDRVTGAGTLSYDSGAVIGGIVGTGTFNLTDNLNIGSIEQPVVTFDGVLGGAAYVLTKISTNTQVFAGTASRTTGNTNINAGVIRLANGNGLYASSGTLGTTVVADGAALELSGGIVTPSAAALQLVGSGISSNGALRNLSGINTFNGSITLNGNATIGVTAGALTIKAVAVGARTLTLSPASGTTLTLGGSASSSTAASAVVIANGTVNGGILNFISLTSSTTGGTSVESGATLDAKGFNATLGGISGTGNITNSTGVSTLTIGTTNNATFGGAISGTISLTKTGTGTQTLSAVSTPTGTVSVNAGTLSVTGSLGAGSTVSVAAAGILDGTGTVNGAVTVAVNGDVGAGLGEGLGNLTLGSLTYSGAGIIAPSATALGTLSKVAVVGALSLGGNVSVNATASSWTQGTYTFATYASKSGVGTFVAGTLANRTGRQTMANVTTNADNATFAVVEGNISTTWDNGINGTWYNNQPTGWLGPLGVADFRNGDTVTFDIAFAAGGVDLAGEVSVAGLTMTGTDYAAFGIYSLNNSTLSVSGNITINGANVEKSITATVNHLASNTIAVGTSVAFAVGPQVLGGTGSITLASGAVLFIAGGASDYTPNIVTNRTISTPTAGSTTLGTNSFSLNQNAVLRLQGVISGANSATTSYRITYCGTGVIELSAVNTYKQMTAIEDGFVESPNAGGNVLRVTATGAIDASSAILIQNGGILELEASTFTRNYGSASTNYRSGTGGGGWSAYSSGGLTVSGTTTLTLGTSFTTQWPSTGEMYFGTAFGTAKGRTTLTTPINLNGNTLNVTVFTGVDGPNTESSSATLSGLISGTSVLSELQLNGGNLAVTNTANTYRGNTIVSNGKLTVAKLANNGVNSSLGFGDTDPASPASILLYTNGVLDYVGTGDTCDRPLSGLLEASSTWGRLENNGTGSLEMTSTLGGYIQLGGTASASIINLCEVQGSLLKTGTCTWRRNTYSAMTPSELIVQQGVFQTGNIMASFSTVSLASSLQVLGTDATNSATFAQIHSLATTGSSARLIIGA
jgi:fibronectin-binding autotransporter adhesin